MFPVYAGGQYVLNTYGVSGNPAQSNVFCGINKTDDGSRTAEKGDAHRDVIMARTGETYLIKQKLKYVPVTSRMLFLPSTSSVHVPNGKWGRPRILHRRFYGFPESVGGDEDNSTALSTLGKCKDANGTKINNTEAFKASFLQRTLTIFQLV